VHFETYGSGRPVILLHGWLGSWNYWLSTMEYLRRGWRCYALDFWGFGESDKSGKRTSFMVTDFVELVYQFMERMGIESAPLVGHSMGGTVSLMLALQHPERVSKVVVVGSPIHGSSLNILLRLAGVPWIGSITRSSPRLLFAGIKTFSPFITKQSRQWYEMISQDISNTTVESFFASIGSLRRTDLREQLGTLGIPAYGIYGPHDVIVNPNQAKVLSSLARNSRIAWLNGSGHFPMLDETQRFNETLRDLLTDEPAAGA
jgi:pimeloyl-ACP methyl ester carboxylesterase